MLAKPITEITEDDLDRLVAERTPERRTIDFKRDLPAKTDEARKEFLYDVSSFANAAGGHLVFGIDEREGAAISLTGVEIDNVDQLKVTFSERIRDGIRPAISGAEIETIKLRNGRYAVIISIPRSWNPPHQVVFQKSFRFYGRDTNNKYQIDVGELRTIFSLSNSIAERIRLFRVERIARIVSGEIPYPIRAGARTITHILPFSAFAQGDYTNLDGIAAHTNEFVTMIGGHSFNRYNVDGYAVASEDAYAQVFNNGAVEIVRAWSDQVRSESLGRPYIPGGFLEDKIREQMQSTIALLRKLGVTPPIALMLSIVGVNNWYIAAGNGLYGLFDRDVVLPPEVVIESFNESEQTDSATLITSLWRAAGRPRSPVRNG